MFRLIRLAKFQATIETALNLMQATLNDLGKSTAKAYFDQISDPFDALGQILFSSFVKIHKYHGEEEARRFAYLAIDALDNTTQIAKSTLQRQALSKYAQLLRLYADGSEPDRLQQMLKDKGLAPELPFYWQSGYAPWRSI